jgi:putative ABC transport system permease protein
LLKPGAGFDPILEKFPAFYNKYMKSVGDMINGSFTLMAKPLARVHHYSSDLAGDEPGGNIKYIFVFAAVAILILVIACINYMNLATARSAKRSKETGMRKIAGAQRRMLIRQFLTESLLIAVFSTLLALLLSRLMLPVFNMIANKSLSFSVLWTPSIICGIAVIAILMGLISGSYPAFYLSSFDPVNVIKGQADTRGGYGLLRKILVVFQFSISVVMITGTLVISSQLRFLQRSDPGFNRDNLVVMTMRDTTFKKSLEPFRQELLKNPDILGVAFSSGNPGYGMSIQVMRIEGDSGSMVDRAINNFYADYDYLDLMGIKITEGRNYDRNMKSDVEKAFVINETAARKFGWVDSSGRINGNYTSALGKRFMNGVPVEGNDVRDGQIIGVVRDFHYASMRNPIEPVVVQLNDQDRYHFFANIRLSEKNRRQSLEYIDKTRQKFNDRYPFQYKFLDASLRDYYQGEKRISMLAHTFAILTIIIASLGLLGLSSFLTQIRTREIGIRKVAGASANLIVAMFVREFSVWILLANIIAAPVTFFVLNKWLQSFPYKTGIHLWIFVAGLILSLSVALLTVSIRVIQAASVNPSDALRYT